MDIGRKTCQNSPLKLHLNEHLSPRISQQLRKHGFDVTSSHEANLLAEPDEQQLNFAVKQHRAIVTFNVRDFATLHYAYKKEGLSHWGIIFSPPIPIGTLFLRLLRLLNTKTAEELKDMVVWLNEFK